MGAKSDTYIFFDFIYIFMTVSFAKNIVQIGYIAYMLKISEVSCQYIFNV